MEVNRKGMVFYAGAWRTLEAVERRRERHRERMRELMREVRKNPEYRERENKQKREYWHRPDGGWFVARKRELQQQREAVLEELHQTEEEIRELEQGHS